MQNTKRRRHEPRTVSLAEFRAEMKAQGMASTKDIAFRCVMCGTIQSSRDFAAAGCPEEKISGQVGFSCIGRWTNAGPHRANQEPGRGCDWTLGGLFSFSDVIVVLPDGELQPAFELATPDDAATHARRFAAFAGDPSEPQP